MSATGTQWTHKLFAGAGSLVPLTLASAEGISDAPAPGRHLDPARVALVTGISLSSMVYLAAFVLLRGVDNPALPSWALWASTLPCLSAPLVPLGLLATRLTTRRLSRTCVEDPVVTELAPAAVRSAWWVLALFMSAQLVLLAPGMLAKVLLVIGADPVHLWNALPGPHRLGPGQAPQRLLVTSAPILVTTYVAVLYGGRQPLRLIRLVLAVVLVGSATRVVVAGEPAGQVLLAGLFDLCLAGTYVFPINWLLVRARLTDVGERRRHEQDTRTRLDQARLRAHRRVRGLVHDHVLAALLSALPERGVPRRAVRDMALRACDMVEQGSVPARAATPEDLVEQLRSWCARHSQERLRLGVETRVAPDALPVPAEVVATLGAAALELVRNIERHASGPPAGAPSDWPGTDRTIYGQVMVSWDAEGLALVVSDNGVGFDPASRHEAQDRLGLSSSVVERVESLVAGFVQVRSAPNLGTCVTLRWSPQAPQPHLDPAECPAARAEGSYDCERAPGSPASQASGRVPAQEQEAVLSLSRDALADAARAPAVRAGVAFVVLTVWVQAAVMRSPSLPTSAALAMAGVLTGAFLLVDSTRPQLTGWHLAGAVLLPSVAAVVFLVSWTPAPLMSDEGWIYSYTALVCSLLVFRKHVAVAWACLANLLVVSVLTSLVLGSPVGAVAVSVAYQGVHLLGLWATVLLALVAEKTAVRAADRLRLAEDRAAAAGAALEEEARLLSEVTALARPALGRLAQDTEPLSPQQVTEVVIAEACLRDLVRVPRLARDRVLAASVESVRRKGVRVTLLDDDVEAVSLQAPLPDGLHEAASTVFQMAGEGDQVVVRVCPAHAHHAATVLLRHEEGGTKSVVVSRGLAQGPG